MKVDEDYLSRFGGIGRLYGTASLTRLASAHVCVVGVGGVGSWVVEALARSGIGALTLIDLDDICITNINRQLPALTQTIGQPKVTVLANRVHSINPRCEVSPMVEFLTESNAARLLTGPFDFVVDAVDRMSIKALIISTSQKQGHRVITIGSAGGRRDPSLIKLADLGMSGRDPLLQQTRRKMRQDHGYPHSEDGGPREMGVTCVFSTEKPTHAWADGTCNVEPEPGHEPGLRLDCAAGFGAATFVTGAFAFTASAEVVRRLVSA
jgi:tRNA A37 threonylcarbamoyladenosine dehydratase